VSSVSDHYAASAAGLRNQYASVDFEQVHAAVLPFLPEPGARIADIGAGSGRDARALADRGYSVTAVEPSAAMRRHASLMDRRANLNWIDDQLPDLSRLTASDSRFDFILCSAVLMHISGADLPRAFETFRTLMVPGARLAISVRPPRSGDRPGVFNDHSLDEIVPAAAGAGLDLLKAGADVDLLQRIDVEWSCCVFSRPPGSPDPSRLPER